MLQTWAQPNTFSSVLLETIIAVIPYNQWTTLSEYGSFTPGIPIWMCAMTEVMRNNLKASRRCFCQKQPCLCRSFSISNHSISRWLRWTQELLSSNSCHSWVVHYGALLYFFLKNAALKRFLICSQKKLPALIFTKRNFLLLWERYI